MKNWLTSQIAKREAEFKEAIQKSEREIMSSFAFKKDLPLGMKDDKVIAHSTMSETMNLLGDHVQINYVTEFEGKDMDDTNKKLR